MSSSPGFPLDSSGLNPGRRPDGTNIDFAELSPDMTRPFHGLRVWLPLKSHAADTFSACLGGKPNLAFPILLKLKSPPCIEVLAPPELFAMVFAMAAIPWQCISERNQHSQQLLAVVDQKNRELLFALTFDGFIAIRVAIVVSRTHQPHLDRLPEDLTESARQLQLEYI